jgi:hypothetical protein
VAEYSEKFMDRAASLYGSIRGRAREKRNKNGRVTRQGYTIPFTTEDLRVWLLKQFGGAEGGCARCPYCRCPIDVYNCVIDHADPLKRGGSPGLGNLVACCATDNDVKGQMNRAEYEWFVASMRDMQLKFGAAPVKNITSRLESQTKLAAQARWNQAKEFKKKAEQVAQMIEDPDF